MLADPILFLLADPILFPTGFRLFTITYLLTPDAYGLLMFGYPMLFLLGAPPIPRPALYPEAEG